MPSQIDPQLPVDPGNPLLAAQPSQIFTAIANTPVGQRLIMTLRTPSTTLTLFLDKNEAANWGAQITGESVKMSGSGLFIPGAVIPVNGQG